MEPIKLKHLALTKPQFLIIKNYTVNNGDVEVESIYQEPESIEADFIHTKETNQRKAISYANDLAVWLLRRGTKITFKDGRKSIDVIKKLSPPLYDKYLAPSLK